MGRYSIRRSPSGPGTDTRTAYYARLNVPAGMLQGASLEDKLKEAFSSSHSRQLGSHWKNRIHTDKVEIVINEFRPFGSSNSFGPGFGAEVFVTRRENLQVAVEQSGDDPFLKLKDLPELIGLRWLSSIMYFWVSGNHVIIIPAKSAGIDALERHLHWALARQAKVIPELMPIHLVQAIDRRLSDAEIQDLREIIVRNPLAEGMLTEALSRMNKDSALWQIRRENAFPKILLQALKLAGGSAAPIDAEYEIVTKSHAIAADLKLSLKVSDASRTREGVNALLHIIRDIPDEMITLKTKGARAYRGRLRLIRDIRIEQNSDSAALNTMSAWKCMALLLRDYINGGSVDP